MLHPQVALLLSLPAAGAIPFSNECLLGKVLEPPTKDAPATFLSECPAWVINTTDLVWNTKPDVNTSLEEYFYKDFESHSSFGRIFRGMDALKSMVKRTQAAFPDLRVHITDVYCVGNDVDGYKTIMPDILTGTNLGASDYGPATNRSVSYSGLAVSYVQQVRGKWQYIAEWVLHDELSIYRQLGLDNSSVLPSSSITPNPGCGLNQPSWGWKPDEDHAATELESRTAGQSLPTVKSVSDDRQHQPQKPDFPLSKKLIRGMDDLISNHVDCFDFQSWSKAMQPFWIPDMVYDTNWHPNSSLLNNGTGLWSWFNREHVPFNQAFPGCTFSQMLFLGEELTAATTTYTNAVFSGDFAGIRHTGKPITFRIFDFYEIDGSQRKIRYNWMILDLVHIMHQTGPRVLPRPSLREGWVQPPRAMDGIPAPFSLTVDPELYMKSKGVVSKLLAKEWKSDRLAGDCSLWASDMIWYGPEGIGMATSCKDYFEHFLQPLYLAFPSRDVEIDVLTCEGAYCGAHGTMVAKNTGPWLGQAASNTIVKLRFGMHYRVTFDGNPEGEVADSYALFDLPGAFKQMGVDLFSRAQLPVDPESFNVVV